MTIPKKGQKIKAYDGVIIKEFMVLSVSVGACIILRCERLPDRQIMDVNIYDYNIAQ